MRIKTTKLKRRKRKIRNKSQRTKLVITKRMQKMGKRERQ